MVSQYRTLLRLAVLACASLGSVSGMYGATTLTATSPSVNAGGTDQFNLQVDSSLTPSTAQILWAVWPALGSVSSSGLYTAPSSLIMSHNLKVVALIVPKDPSLAPVVAYSPLLVQPAVAISLNPSSAAVGASGTVQFTPTVSNSTNANVTWSLSPAIGTISSSGLYTAPSLIASSQTVTVTATSTADNTQTASATISLVPAVSVSLTPATATLSAGQTTQFTPTVTNSGNPSVTWSMSSSLGTISSSGLYTAPSTLTTQQTVVVTATSAAYPTAFASATITLNPAQQQAIVMPLELMGTSATTQSVQVTVPAGQTVSGAGLWLQIHGLEYQTQASIQVNNSGWIALNNANTQLQGLGGNYGGIGGGFSTLTMLVPLPANTVQTGANTVSFQFNGTDGNSSGYRVLAFNFQLANGTQVIPSTAFTQDDPTTWGPPSTAASDIAAGKTLYQTATLIQPVPGGSPKTLKAHCGDCHTQDGRDLKYFNYSNNTIYARSMFHGLNATQANQIVSYIRSLSAPAPAQARPWNPPYQPGPGLDSQPVTNWAAGAGLNAVLASDAQMLPYVTPTQTTADFSPSGNLNLRNTPVAFQLMDWNHWLPRVHPLDAYGSTFSSSQVYADYLNLRADLIPGSASSYQNNADALGAWGGMDSINFRQTVEPVSGDPSWSNPNTAAAVYGINQWNVVKLWEINQEFQLEGMAQVAFGPTADSRAWDSAVPFGVSPSIMQIPPGSPGIHNGSVTTFNYVSFSWYYSQLILNPGNGHECGGVPVDFAYYFGFVQHISGESGPQGMLALTSLIKAMQVQNTGATPLSSGCPDWNLGRIEPIFIASPTAPLMWSGVSSTTRVNLLNAYMTTWLSYVSQFTPQQYYQSGQTSPNETIIPGLPFQGLADDMAYAIPRLHYQGVTQSLTNSLISWAIKMWPSTGYNWNALASATCIADPSSGALSCSSD